MLLFAVALTFFLPTLTEAAMQDQGQVTLYEQFIKQRSEKEPASQKAAYETGKEYLTKYGAPVDQYNTYVRGWMGKYEKAVRDFEFRQAVAQKDVTKVFKLGREIFVTEPDNLYVYLGFAQVGYGNAVDTGNKSIIPETLTAARRALELIGQGKTLPEWKTAADRDDRIGELNYLIGYFSLESSPGEAAKAFVKVIQSNSKLTRDASPYLYLAKAYYSGEVSQLAAEYKAKYEGRPETSEGAILYEKINQSLDRVIDAYARAVALSKTADEKIGIMKNLTTVYKARHDNSDAGLAEYLEGVLSRPLPIPAQ
jgi:hypothetical protein